MSKKYSRSGGLTLDMVHKLSTEWHIPAGVLVRPYHLATDDKAGTKRRAAA